MSESWNHQDQNVASAAPDEAQEEKSSESLPESSPPAKKRRGFAVMDPKRVSEIASKGGKAAHAAGTAHEFSREEAREAGRKGGYATHARRKAAKGTGQGAPPQS
jgi:general stress protein YciG